MKTSTLNEINRKAQAVLARELDPMEYIQFFRQYELGSGDYTQDRENWLGQPTVDQIADEFRSLRVAES